MAVPDPRDLEIVLLLGPSVALGGLARRLGLVSEHLTVRVAVAAPALAVERPPGGLLALPDLLEELLLDLRLPVPVVVEPDVLYWRPAATRVGRR